MSRKLCEWRDSKTGEKVAAYRSAKRRSTCISISSDEITRLPAGFSEAVDMAKRINAKKIVAFEFTFWLREIKP